MRCKICKNNTLVTFRDSSKEYLFCKNCELIWLQERYCVDSKREKEQYDYHNNSIENQGYVNMFEDFMDFFWDDLGLDAKKALDFGSGPTPVLAQLLEKRGLHVEYFDKYYQPLEIYRDKKYDLITSTEVFEHLKNPLESLKLLKEHLKNGGLISIMTLFHPNDKDIFLTWWYGRDPTHITFYTPKTFRVLADLAGLKVLKHDDKRVVVLTHKSLYK